MIEGRTIICIASNWFYDPTSKHHVMHLLSEQNHVIWVNYHASRRPRLTAADAGAVAGKLKQVFEGPRRVSPTMTVVTPLVVPLPGSRVATRLNRSLLTRQIRSVLRSPPERPVQLWAFAPDVDFLCGQFGEECVVYYCVDEFSAFSGYDREAVVAAERRLIDRADLVVATSQALYETRGAMARRAALVTHGVDVDHFATTAGREIPRDVASLRRPVLGFWGLIQDWFDVNLVAGVARARPDWNIVLVGEVATDVSALRACGNVHLPGRRSYAELPSFAKGFDAGLIPFRVNELTRAVNPIKLREYLSAGLPVVSTPLPEVTRYGEFVETGEGVEGFVGGARALASAGMELSVRRRESMRNETWRSKVRQLSELVASVRRSSEGGGQSSRAQEGFAPAPAP